MPIRLVTDIDARTQPADHLHVQEIIGTDSICKTCCPVLGSREQCLYKRHGLFRIEAEEPKIARPSRQVDRRRRGQAGQAQTSLEAQEAEARWQGESRCQRPLMSPDNFSGAAVDQQSPSAAEFCGAGQCRPRDESNISYNSSFHASEPTLIDNVPDSVLGGPSLLLPHPMLLSIF